MTLHPIEEVYGEGCDLYKLLGCESQGKAATKAQLRKGYYRAALKGEFVHNYIIAQLQI